MTVYDESIHMK